MPRCRRQLAVVTAVLTSALLITSSSLAAQTVPVRTLVKPDAELRDPFTAISSIRELTDGRVLISDSRDKVVQLADLSRQQLTKIGREGSGPGEYVSPGRLYALSADTTLLYDFANNRFLVITGDGNASSTRPYDTGPIHSSSGLVGIDELGRVYLSARPAGSTEEGGAQTIMRYTVTTRRVDTITTISLPVGRRSGAMAISGGMLKMFTNLPYAPEDVAAVSSDGRVAVARVSDYRAEWFAAGGRRVAGTPIGYEAIRITPAEKRAFLERQIRPGSITVRNNGAAGQARALPNAGPLPGGRGGPDALDDTGMQWPARKPPFLAGAASVDRDGRLWILRATAHDDKTPRYDVFDANGRLALQVVLPAKTALVGFGRKTVYLARTDDDDLRYLQRYAAP